MNLRDQLQAVYDRRGQLTPEMLVDEARDEAHPLHTRFEWDDAVAGEAYRRQQAGELIRSVKIVYRPATARRPAGIGNAYQSVRSADGQAYHPSEKVAEDPFMRSVVLADMAREWKALKRRYEQFAEFAAMVRADLAEDEAA